MKEGSENQNRKDDKPIGHVVYLRSPESIEFSVAVAIIERDGKFLAGKRPSGKAYAGKWEFAGGKIKHEAGETLEQGLRREVEEELGVSLAEVAPFLEWDYQFPDGNLFHLFAFRCSVTGTCVNLIHEEIGWFTADELAELDFIESDRVLIDSLKQKHKKK